MRARWLVPPILLVGVILTPGLVLLAVNPVVVQLPYRVLQHQSVGAAVRMVEAGLYVDPIARELSFDPALGRTTLDAAWARCGTAGSLHHCGLIAWHDGRFGEAGRLFEADIATHGESADRLWWLGLAYMRRAEQHNCLEAILDPVCDPGEHAGHDGSHQGMCALPLTVLHDDPTDTRLAAKTFERLERTHGPRPLWRWFVNFSHMPDGSFPEGVPEDLRLPTDTPFYRAFWGDLAAAARTEHGDLVLVDRAPELGVDFARSAGGPDAGKGVAVEDFDGDGCLDIVTGGFFDRMSMFRNLCGEPGTLGFEDVSVASGLADIQGTHILTAADMDGDGAIDLFVSRPFGSPRGDAVLLRNRGDGSFEDVTVAAGLAPPEGRYQLTWGSTWGDVDLDGDLDLFVANYHFGSPFHKTSPLHAFTSRWDHVPSRLWRNDGGVFVDITDASGLGAVTDGHNVHAGAWGDHDGDGDLDLAISRAWIPGVTLLENDGDGHLVDRGALSASAASGFMVAFVDSDQDGRLDLFVSGYGTGVGSVRQAVFQHDLDSSYDGDRVWMQAADGSFDLHTDVFGAGLPLPSMGSSFGDVDHDGNLDWYLGTGGVEPWHLVPNRMFRGTGGGALTDISALPGAASIQKGHGVVYADLDRDGDQDIYASLGGGWPGDRWPNQLFVNEGESTHAWVRLRLHGCTANRFGLGSQVAVTTRHPDGRTRTRWHHMDQKTAFGSAPYLADLGLGDAVEVVDVVVRWLGPQGRVVHYAGEPRVERILVESGAVVEGRAAAERACVAAG